MEHLGDFFSFCLRLHFFFLFEWNPRHTQRVGGSQVGGSWACIVSLPVTGSDEACFNCVQVWLDLQEPRREMLFVRRWHHIPVYFFFFPSLYTQKKTKKKKQQAGFPVQLTDFRRHRKGSLRLRRKCMCVLKVCTHPPEVLAVGVFGYALRRVNLAHQWTEASPFRDVLPAAHADHLWRRAKAQG